MLRDDLDRIEAAILEGLRGVDARLGEELRRAERETSAGLGAVRERLVALEQRGGGANAADVERLREIAAELRVDIKAVREKVDGVSKQVYVWSGGVAVLAFAVPLVMRALRWI